MKRETMNIKDHACPSCGGTLRVDVARQMYECPFCGMTFDYDYFREENVLGLADKALNAGEVYSARQAYEFMLTKEPDNFVALRGISLVDMKMSGVDKLKNVDNYRSANYAAANSTLDKAIEMSRPENKEYFVLMKDMLAAGHEYFREDKLIQTEIEQRSKAADKLEEKIKERDEVSKDKEGNPMDAHQIIAFWTAWLIFWCVVCTMIFAAVHLSNPYSEKNYKKRSEETTRVGYTVQTYNDDYWVIYNAYNAVDTEGMDSAEASEAIQSYVAEHTRSYEDRRESEEEQREREERIKEEQEEEERLRRKNEAEWKEKHQKDIPAFIAAIAIPSAIVGAVAFSLKRRQKKYNSGIDDLNKIIEGHSAKIRSHEENKNELKERIASSYKVLSSFDPVI